MSPEEAWTAQDEAELEHCERAVTAVGVRDLDVVDLLLRERARVRAASKAEVEALTKRVAELEDELADERKRTLGLLEREFEGSR